MEILWRLISGDPGIGPLLTGSYSAWLVIASYCVATLASFTAFSVVERIQASKDRSRRIGWYITGMVMLGSGIWAMHFTGMLAYSMHRGSAYNIPLTIISIVPAIIGSKYAIEYKVARYAGWGKLHLNGLLMASGIAIMHYTGMEAMQMNAELRYDVWLFALSIVVGHLLAVASLYISNSSLRNNANLNWGKILSALGMGGCITAIHYTAMASTRMFDTGGSIGTPLTGIDGVYLATIIFVIISMLLFGAIILTRLDRWRQDIKNTLYETESREKVILETVAEGVMLLDGEGAIELVNKAGADMFGYRPNLLVSRPFELLIPGVNPHFGLHFPDRVQSWESVGVRINGSEFPVSISCTNIEQDGNIKRAIIVRDITQEKQSKLALIKQQKQAYQLAKKAEAANLAKSQFLATMSHEIRTPMNGVIGMISLLQLTDLTDEQSEYVMTIKDSSDMLLKIIEQILDFSNVEAGKIELDILPMDLWQCVEESAELVKHAAEKKGLALTVAIEEGVPQSIFGDAIRIRQILINLLENAIKFTEEGGVFLSVAAAAAEAEDMFTIHFSVRDTGIGVSGEHKEQLFEAFRQLDASDSRKYGGTGLGLAISQELCELMGSTIQVESPGDVGTGSTFSFTIEASLCHALSDAVASKPAVQLH